jgi:hypothetical protein
MGVEPHSNEVDKANLIVVATVIQKFWPNISRPGALTIVGRGAGFPELS